MSKLPIEVSDRPGCFKWQQEVDTIGGKRVVDHDGAVPAALVRALRELIEVAKKLITDNMVMRGSLSMTVDRLGGQVEGRPTNKGNFLQRVDELVAIEEQRAKTATVPAKRK